MAIMSAFQAEDVSSILIRRSLPNIEKQLFMYSLKDYPEDYSQSESKQWRKFKKALKKLAHKQLRRGNDKYVYHGKEIAW